MAKYNTAGLDILTDDLDKLGIGETSCMDEVHNIMMIELLFSCYLYDLVHSMSVERLPAC